MKKSNTIYRMIITSLMAALVYVCTMIKIPLGESNISIANTVCILCGLILDPVHAGMAAGLGSALNDLTFGGYGALDAGITFFSKFLMGFVCSLGMRLIRKNKEEHSDSTSHITSIITFVIWILCFIALFLLRSTLESESVKGYLIAVIIFACAVLSAVSKKKVITVGYAAAFILLYTVRKLLDACNIDLYRIGFIFLVWFGIRFISSLIPGVKEEQHFGSMTLVCGCAALTYVLLYMLKTFLLGLTLYNLTLSATYVKMGAKLPASLINAIISTLLAPRLFGSLEAPLTNTGVFSRLRNR